ncbi:MAG: YgfZ/GcvT domain-containing protein [Woeseiaceae bacterium]
MSDLTYSNIVASGADAETFLQAQLANDLTILEHQDSLLSAWCNPKGRVICLFRVRRNPVGFTMMLPADLADAVVARMEMFRFRANAEFEVRPTSAEDLRLDGSFDDWLLTNLRAGIPEIKRAQSEEFTAHMLSLDLLGAVSLDKGCYPGQEIISRTHYRGASRRRLALFESDTPVAEGDKVSDGKRNVGDVVNAIGNELLAVVPVDQAELVLQVSAANLTPRPMSPS